MGRKIKNLAKELMPDIPYILEELRLKDIDYFEVARRKCGLGIRAQSDIQIAQYLEMPVGYVRKVFSDALEIIIDMLVRQGYL